MTPKIQPTLKLQRYLRSLLSARNVLFSSGKSISPVLIDFIWVNSLLRIFAFHSIHLIFLRIISFEQDPKHPSSNKSWNTNTGIHPDQLGIHTDTWQSDRKSATERSGKQKHWHDERFHAWWSFGISIFETGNWCKDFRECDQDVWRNLSADVDCTVCIASGEIITRRRRINPVLRKN